MVSEDEVRIAREALGVALTAARKAAGLSQHSLARAINYGRSSVANVETGRQNAPRRFWQDCDQILNTGTRLTGEHALVDSLANRYRSQITAAVFAAKRDAVSGTRHPANAAPCACRTPDRSDQDPYATAKPSREIDPRLPVSETEEMLRRTVITALATVVTGQASEGITALTVDGGGLRSPAAVDGWHEAVWEYGYAYFTTPRQDLLLDLVGDFTTIIDQMRRSSAADRRQLAGPAAHLGALTAKACTDLGYARESRHAWRHARRLADESGDESIRSWVRGHESVGGLYQNRPLPVVLELALRGLATTPDSPTAGRIELLGGKAQTLAMMGHHEAALAALDETRTMFNALPDEVRSLTESVFGWPEQSLRHTESFVLTHSGRIRDAYTAQDRALQLYPAAQIVSHCQIRLHRAYCLIREGHITEGITQADGAVSRLPTHRRKRIALTVAARVVEAVPLREQRRPQVVQYRELLQTSAD
ncbi:hypothetical protein F4553_008088 [Allocatelliglobosispora scoriae]|uniref:HTH cro/C1-type domain-containing protein n=1 Tax=Allocatelliglobosispora scoriae TaxID=643052 RepID=A0A841C2R8_9ACTN|nr:helix-turn-helix transcriptional regulator [Allocatelliglobosispora scoriae]MBB5874654.1 hypothetical protein [Allocatelliglobosispora scoriae]